MKKVGLKEVQVEKAATIHPPIKWAGGKRWLAPEIEKLYRESKKKRIVEPFCGGCAVSLHIQPKEALLNDINKPLITFWNYISRGGKLLSVGGNDEAEYDRARDHFNNELNTYNNQEIASFFYYLNRTCFNGLYRTNLAGKFNVPFGKYSTITYNDSWPEIAAIAKKWKFVQGDFFTLSTRKDDFVYIDPPYDGGFTAFAAGGFNIGQQLELGLWASKQPGFVVVSNSATPRMKSLYKDLGFNVKIIDAPRRISSDGNRQNAKEILAIKSNN